VIKVEYKNRYGEVFSFVEQEDGNIQWGGDFKYCRIGWPNNYSEAWKKFQEDYGGLSFEDFKENVHAYDEEKNAYVFPELIKLVKSDTNRISMVDPSGGPYITEGMDMGLFSKVFKAKKVKDFIPNKEGYLIVVE
jgi:hypothetical protein